MSLFRSLLLVIAGSTQRELARQVRYLKVENEILRGKLPNRITITPKERQRLVKFGAKLGKALHQLVTIVTPGTFLRWIREEKRVRRTSTVPAKRGRRRTAEQIRRLVVKMARENTWGYARIVGELKKLGIGSIKKSTVRNILKTAGLDPCPKRTGATWDEFVTRHAVSLWQCDFFTQKVLTVKGLREVFVLAFLNVRTRRVVLSPATFHPDAAWVAQQAEVFVKQARSNGLRVRYVQRDRDRKFAGGFDRALRKRHVKVVKSPAKAPNTQAFVERFIGSLRNECLNHFVFFGMRHLYAVARSWLDHYHAERPHQGVENELLVKPPGVKKSVENRTADEMLSLQDIRCRQRLGGLLKHYERVAA
jgi:putative transposase